MTDRELLELAAKSAGLNVKAQSVNADDRWLGFIVGEKHTKERKFWNPLTDDGDALRLTVKLGLCVRIDNRVGFSWVKGFEGSTSHDNDRYAATRRAIVRAAAEIGSNHE